MNVIFIVMTSMITKAKTTLFEIMITNKQINKQTNKYIVKTNVIFILMTTMITSAKTTLFEIMITKKQTNQSTNKQTNKQIYCKDKCYLYCNDDYYH